jgi:phosphoglycolate phosphatase-like HAD superfamily hydrolase
LAWSAQLVYAPHQLVGRFSFDGEEGYTMSVIKLVLIDFDDTLALTEAACFELENDIAARMGLVLMSRQIHQQTWGQPLAQAIQHRFPGINVQQFMSLHRQLMPDYVERGDLDGITDANLAALVALRQQGRKMAVLTSRTGHEVEHLLDSSHQLASVLDGFYYADNLPVRKPDPAVFNGPLADFGVTAEETVYIGDSVSDAVCAKQAGLYFLAVTESGLRGRTDFDGLAVDAFVSTFAEAATSISDLEQPGLQ